MAVNTNKRVAIKWIRDKAKSAYIKESNCFICNTDVELELHHTHGLTNLFEKWAKENNYDISTDESVLEVREEFIDTHHQEIYVDVFTLCNKHHLALHKIYGKSPSLSTAGKQKDWINAQRDKIQNPDKYKEEQEAKPKKSFFGAFI